MGTRNLTIVTSNGKTKVAQYGQWDGYPGGQGLTALSTLKRIIHNGQLGQFKAKIDNMQWLDKEGAEKIEKDENWTVNYPYLSRDCGAQILEAIHFGTMQVHAGIGEKKEVTVNVIGLSDQYEFAADSLFCEWAYVIDLDKGTFEVYEGFNKTPLTETDRFYPLQVANKEQGEYYPIKLLASFDINNLPSEPDFLAIEKEEEATEDLPI